MAATIGSRMRFLRKSKGITGTFIARKMGISSSAYSQIENDQRRLRAEFVPIICDALDVDISYFFDQVINKNATIDEVQHETTI